MLRPSSSVTSQVCSLVTRQMRTCQTCGDTWRKRMVLLPLSTAPC